MGNRFHLTLDADGLASVDDLRKSIQAGAPLSKGIAPGAPFNPTQVDLVDIVILDLFKAGLPTVKIAKVANLTPTEVADKLVGWRLIK